jgi:hypothetical protein
MLWFEQLGVGWRALIVHDDSRLAFSVQGVGRTKLEAAEDAKRRWESGTRVVRVADVGTTVEHAEALPIKVVKAPPAAARAGGNQPSVRVDVPAGGAQAGGFAPTPRIEVDSRIVERLTEYGWVIRFGEEPDGRVRGYLCDDKTLQIIRSAVGDDLQDAFLGLGIDLTAPSAEGRCGRADDPSDPRL